MSKPSAARSGSTAATPRKPPHERGKSSYQAPNRARSRSTSIRSTALLTALLRLRSRERLRREAPLVDACRRRRAPAPRTARRSGRPGRPPTLRSCSSSQLAYGIDPGLDPELPGAERVRRDARLEVVVAPAARAAPRASVACRRAGSGRRLRACRGRRGRSSRSTVTVSPRHALTGKRPQSTCGWTCWIWIRCRLHPRQGKQSDDVAHPFRRRQPPPDLAAGRQARARGVRIRRLARRRRSALLAGAAAQSTRRASALRTPPSSAFASWPGLLADPDAVVEPSELRRFEAEQRVLDRRLGRVRGRRRARRPGAVPARVVGPARVRRRARRAADRRRADLRRRGQLRPRGAPRALPPRRLRRGRATRPAQRAAGRSGAIRSTTGMRSRARATAGGPSGCAGCSASSTRSGSTTSAASPTTGRCRRAETAREGHWARGPGAAVFLAAERELGDAAGDRRGPRA